MYLQYYRVPNALTVHTHIYTKISFTVNDSGSDREVYEEMKRLFRILGATVLQVI